MVAPIAQVRIGCSGYQYDHWRGVFYPQGLPKRDWFGYYAEHFDTVEINNTFYRVPDREVFETWREQAPPGFVYALKFSKFGTHNKKLLNPEGTIEYFLERAAPLAPVLGPILVHLPPRWRCNAARLEAFLDAAPPRPRWAVEVRHESWLCKEVYRILERHNAALCLHDILQDHPRVLTADWTYLRFHGATGAYAGVYGEDRLRPYAAWIREQQRAGVGVYAYFNNDVGGHAVRDALALRGLVELGTEGTQRTQRRAEERRGKTMRGRV